MTNERATKRFPKTGWALVFLAILLTLAIQLPNCGPSEARAKIIRAEAQLRTIRAALVTYREENGAYPQSLTHLVQPPKEPRRQRPIMTREGLVDSWGEAFDYELLPTGSKTPYRLLSKGPDRLLNTEDDIALEPAF